MTRETLKLALEAMILNNAEWKRLADSGDGGDWSAEEQDHYKQTEQAITAIKEALAQPEQEPVAHTLNCVCGAVWDIKADGSEEMVHTPDITPPQRTWVGLTDEEVITMSRYDLEYAALIGEVQRRLKEKNNG